MTPGTDAPLTQLPPPPPPPAKPATTAIAWVGIVGCAAAVIGSFMAWITLSSAFGTVNFSGMDGDGKLTATVAGLAGLSALVGVTKASRREMKWAVCLATLGVAMTGFEWYHVSDKIELIDAGELARVSVGMGIWVMLAGFIVAAFCLANALGHQR